MAVDKLDFQQIIELIQRDPLAAAGRLDALAGQMRDLADQLRRLAGVASAGIVDSPGSGDRVTIEVRGPHGELKQRSVSER